MCKTFFWGTIRKGARLPLSSRRPARLPKYARKACLPPSPSRVAFYARGAALGRRGACGTVPSANMRDQGWNPPAAGGRAPSHSPVETHTGRTYPRYPAHCPVRGIAGRSRDFGRELPRLPRGTKGKESSDMAVRLPTPSLWRGSGDG